MNPLVPTLDWSLIIGVLLCVMVLGLVVISFNVVKMVRNHNRLRANRRDAIARRE